MSNYRTDSTRSRNIILLYLLFMVLLTLIIAGSSVPETSRLSPADVDKMIAGKWSANNLKPSDRTNDEDFLRRVYIDLVGRVPKADEVTSFLNDKSIDKRSKTIDALLASDEFGQNMADIWINILFTSDFIGKFQPKVYAYIKDYFANEFNSNKPYTYFVNNLLNAKGLASTNPNVLFMSRFQTPEDAAGNVMKIFEGKRIQCAQCHKHPYQNISQDDFWGVAAFYSRMKVVPFFKKDAIEKVVKVMNRYDKLITKARENAMDGNDEMKPKKENQDKSTVKKKDKKRDIPPAWVLDTLNAKLQRSQTGDYQPDVLVYDAVNGQMVWEKKGTKITTSPKYFQGASVSDAGGIERRDSLANHITSADQKLIAREFVNRTWKHFFGYGLVNPIDDFVDGDDNPNQDILNKLTDEFTASNFDVKNLYKLIANTEAYQLSSTPNESNKDDHQFFSRAVLRPLTPVQLANSLLTASGYYNMNFLKDKEPQEVERIKIRIMKFFIFTFDDDEMGEAENYNGTISQALMMMNGDLTQRVSEKRPGNIVAQILNEYKEPSDRIDMLYLNALSRYPSKYEKQDLIDKATNNKNYYEDIEWALLNSSEFIFNH